MGGCDKQGFPMKQGVLTPGRVRLLLHRGNCVVLFFADNLSDVSCTLTLVGLPQAHLASVVMEGAMESGGGSQCVVALLALTSQF